jgi:hypothetical protein
VEPAAVSDMNAGKQLALLDRLYTEEESTETELAGAPLFTYPVLKQAEEQSKSSSSSSFTQYGLLGGDIQTLGKTPPGDPRVFYNAATPSSAFICGSQGSGKSHTLSCLLENCLIASDALGYLPRPLTGIVFHYDDYASDSKVSPCEAAYLGSDPSINVRVLCAPTNIRIVKVSFIYITF